MTLTAVVLRDVYLGCLRKNIPTRVEPARPDVARIKLLCWQKKPPLTVRSLAKKAGCHPSTISRVINGQISDGRWFEWLARELGVRVSDITVSKKRRAA